MHGKLEDYEEEEEEDDIITTVLKVILKLLLGVLFILVVMLIIKFGWGIVHVCHALPPYGSNDYACIYKIGR